MLGDHPGTAALKNGSIKSDLVAFDFVDYSPTNKGFKPMVREAAFDVSEMAIVTYLMAKSLWQADGAAAERRAGAVPARRMRSTTRRRERSTPRDLNGKRVGIRSFTTTTGAWLRGILANDYGVDLDSIDWVTFEDAHVAEFRDTTKRAPAGKQIVQMLLDGELDAVLGEKSEHPDLKPLFADVAAAEESLVREAQGGADQPHGGGEPDACPSSTRMRCGKSIGCLPNLPPRHPPRRVSPRTRCGARWN